MSTYKKPCEYCGELVPPDANVCPFCGRSTPSGPPRCPKCRSPVDRKWKLCSNCGLSLAINCPKCGKPTFYGDYCDSCATKLTVTCSNCKTEQPILNDACVKCKKNLK